MSIKVIVCIIKINLPKNKMEYVNWNFSQNDHSIAEKLLNLTLNTTNQHKQSQKDLMYFDLE